MSLHSEYTASRRYRCDRECGEPIEPGTRYVRAALPPRKEPLYAEGWSTLRLHGPNREDCPAYARIAGGAA